MVADDAMEFGPQAVNVRVAQAFDPVTRPATSFGGPAGPRNFARYGNAGIVRFLSD